MQFFATASKAMMVVLGGGVFRRRSGSFLLTNALTVLSDCDYYRELIWRWFGAKARMPGLFEPNQTAQIPIDKTKKRTSQR
jgi:hypothetical protein